MAVSKQSRPHNQQSTKLVNQKGKKKKQKNTLSQGMNSPASAAEKTPSKEEVCIPHYPSPPHLLSFTYSGKFFSPLQEEENVCAKGFTGTDDDSADDRKPAPKKSDPNEEETLPNKKDTLEPGDGLGSSPNKISEVAASNGLMTKAWKKEGREKEKEENAGHKKKGLARDYFVSNKTDTFKQKLFERRSTAAVEEQLLQCADCKVGKECEWEGGPGVRLRIFARKLSRKYKLEDWQIRYNLYRLYQKGKKFAKGERHPLPFCVEVEIKRAYQGKAPHDYTFYQKGKEVDKDKPKTLADINWLDGWSDAKLATANHVYDYSPK
jgi:hypothetical protein